MDRSKIADLSEIVSSIAIVVTLVYLAIEISQNTNALQAQTRQAVLESAQTELFMLMDNPDVTLALGKTGPLTTKEQIRLDNFLTAVLRSREFAWLQYLDGSIDEAQWSTENAVLITIFDSKSSRIWWGRMGRQAFGPLFVAFVDGELARNRSTDSIWRTAASWLETSE